MLYIRKSFVFILPYIFFFFFSKVHFSVGVVNLPFWCDAAADDVVDVGGDVVAAVIQLFLLIRSFDCWHVKNSYVL